MIKELLPPVVVRYLSSFLYGWTGNYASWEAAQKKCPGYDSDVIFNKVKDSLLKVKNGEAIFERDSVLFDKVQYSFPLLSALSLVAINDNLKLKVLDFGGSLGSAFYQNKKMLENLNELSWNIIEQKHFVEEGIKTFADDKLSFFHTIDDCLQERSINVILLGSVLQYLENPSKLMEDILAKRVDNIIIDRTPIFKNNKDRITIQKVPKNIYEAQYPCWILNEQKMISQICDAGYEMIFDSESPEHLNLNDACLKGYFFKIKK